MRRPLPFVVDGSYYAAAFNLVVAGLLLAGSRWLVRPCARVPGLGGETRRVSGSRLVLVVAGVVLAGGVFARYAVPRLTYSFWVDEETTARQVVFGNYARVDERGKGSAYGEKVVVKPVPWTSTIWFYRTTNNHPFYSVCARASHTLWSKLAPPRPLHFREAALRLPVFLSALVALGLFALLLVRLGFPNAAMIVPLLIAVNPWYIRFGSDARGYGLLFVLAPLCALLLWRALQSGQWRYWVGLALCQFLLAWTHASGIYFLVWLNVWGFLVPWVGRPGSPRSGAAWGANGRLVLASAVSAMLFVQFFLPSLLQYRYRTKGFPDDAGEGVAAAMGWEKVLNMLSWFAGGSAWSGFKEAGHPYSFTLPERFGSNPVLLATFALFVGVLLVLGIVECWRRGGAWRWFPLVVLLPAPMMYGIAWAREFFLFDHHVVIGLPWFGLAVGMGVAALARMVGRTPKGETMAACVFGIVAVALFWWTGKPQRDAYSSRSFEMNREAVEHVRGSLDPEAPGYHDVITAGLLRYPRTYDPYAYNIKSEKDVDRLIAMSDATGKPLYVYCGMGAYGMPIARVLEDERFVPVIHYYGLDGMSELDLYRHDPKPGSVEGP